MQDERSQITEVEGEAAAQDREPWIGVVPLKMEIQSSTGNQDSFADTVVNKVSAKLQVLVFFFFSLMALFSVCYNL